MLSFVTVAFATFSAVVFLLGVLPFRLHPKIMPVITAAIAYFVDHHLHPAVIDAMAAAGVVALVSRFALTSLPEPWSIDDVFGGLLDHLPRRNVTKPPPPRRIPAL